MSNVTCQRRGLVNDVAISVKPLTPGSYTCTVRDTEFRASLSIYRQKI
jgi:hypothetical protein